MKRFTLFLAVFYIAFLTHAQNQVLKPEVFTLENGLTVILNEDPHASTVFGLVAVKAGSKNDPADATGLAHYQEHMLFKGTQELGTIDWEKEKIHINNIFQLYDKLAVTTDENERKKIQMQINSESVEANKYVIPNELDKLLRIIGSTGLNAFTSTDMTVYFNEFPPASIEQWLEIYSHRFINPVFRGFQAELEVVYEEFNMYNDVFVMPLLEQFNKHFFKTHPYGQQTIIGKLEHLKNPSLTKMYDFFQTWYVPNNMALILSGNFKYEEVKPLIEKYFSRWIPKPLPPVKSYEELPFKGRELVQVKMSPVKIGILGFRTIPAVHQDKLALELMVRLLSNPNQTGLLDQLAIDNKLMMAQAMPMPYKEHGALLILFVPKIIGQSLEDAEKLILAEFDKLKKGEFPDELIESMKKQLYVEYLTSLESHQNICVLLAQAFVNEEPLENLIHYPELIMQITKDDVIKIANIYLGNDYLAFFSNMGLPKKQKIEKPGYEPIVSNQNMHSDYYKNIASWKNKTPKHEPKGYHGLVEKHMLENGTLLYFTENPYNDIFTLTIRLYLSKAPEPLSAVAVAAMDYAGTDKLSLKQLKSTFASFGMNYSFSLAGDLLEIKLQGPEDGFEPAIELLGSLIFNPVIEPSKMNVLYENAKTQRKFETADAEGVAEMLYNYIVYGKLSEYLNRPSLKTMKSLKPEQLIAVFNKMMTEPAEFHLVGSRNLHAISIPIIYTTFNRLKPAHLKSRYEIPKSEATETKIIFVNKPNTIQSKIYFYTLGNPYSPEEEAVSDMFNEYFGGGFSGLVLKEIREYRSMAYSAGAIFRKPLNFNSNYSFIGYIGTQADKTFEAIQVFMELVRKMPEKKDEADAIKEYLLQSLPSHIPDFRKASLQVTSDRFLGWDYDPLITKAHIYPELGFADLAAFYNSNLKDKPMVIMVVADKKRLKPKSLSIFGKVEIINMNDLFTK